MRSFCRSNRWMLCCGLQQRLLRDTRRRTPRTDIRLIPCLRGGGLHIFDPHTCDSMTIHFLNREALASVVAGVAGGRNFLQLREHESGKSFEPAVARQEEIIL